MFPSTTDHPLSIIKRGKSKPKTTRKTWQPEYELLSVEPPIVLDHSRDIEKAFPRRRYASIRFKYRDGEGNIKWKTLMFGDPDGEYIGNHIEDRRIQRFARLSHQQDPFHPNYWRLNLLNTEETLEEAYISFIRKVMSITRNENNTQNKRLKS